MDARKAWLEARRRGVGSSDIAALFGRDPWKTRWHVYLDKIGELPDSPTPQKTWGLRLEDAVATAYAEETGRKVYLPEEKTIRHPSIEYMLASPDRFTDIDGQVCVLELKTSGSGEDGEWGTPGTDEIPLNYILQVQHQMGVCNLERADVAVLFGVNDFRIYTVRRSEQIISAIEREVRRFWEQVQSRNPPTPDWEHESTWGLVANLWGADPTAAPLQLGGEEDALARRYLRLGEELAALKKERESVKAQLLYALGSATSAVTEGGLRVTRKLVSRAGFEVGPTEYYRLSIGDRK